MKTDNTTLLSSDKILSLNRQLHYEVISMLFYIVDEDLLWIDLDKVFMLVIYKLLSLVHYQGCKCDDD